MKFRRDLIVVALATFCLTATLFMIRPTRSNPGIGEYDPWADINDDGTVDIYDAIKLAGAFESSGAPLTKASIEYDSGWINITDKCGQNIVVTHNLNSTDLIVDVQGKTTLDSGLHQRNYGLTGYIQGWNKTYGGTSWDGAYALVQTGDGGYALAGATGYSGIKDFWLVKTDAAGNAQWNKTYGGTNDDEAYALVQTGDGGYALAGYTASFGAGVYDFWLVKTDANGNMQWNRTYGGTISDIACALVQTSDDGYALAGATGDFGAGIADCWLVKADSNGIAQWNQTYGGTGYDAAYALVQTVDGGYALAGYTNSFGAGNLDSWLVKTDAAGAMQWNRTYGGTNSDIAETLVQTADGGYALAGTSAISSAPGIVSSDFLLIKTDANGNMQWSRTYGVTEEDWAWALVQTSDDGYALAGYTEPLGIVSSDFLLVKTDASGNIGGLESGLAWVDSSANTITLYRGATDSYWNYVRVRLWKPKTP